MAKKGVDHLGRRAGIKSIHGACYAVDVYIRRGVWSRGVHTGHFVMRPKIFWESDWKEFMAALPSGFSMMIAANELLIFCDGEEEAVVSMYIFENDKIEELCQRYIEEALAEYLRTQKDTM